MSDQKFKSIYFSDYKTEYPQSKGLVIAFGDRHSDLYEKIQDYDSQKFRQLLETDSFRELEERAQSEGLPVTTYCLWYIRKKFAEQEAGVDSRPKIKSIKTFENKVFEGDCLDIMQRLPDRSIDMVLCDLPYGTTQNRWDSVLPLNQLWNAYERIIKDNGAIVLTGHNLFSAQLMLSNTKLFKYKLTWVKSKPTNFLNAKKQPLRKHEDILVFYKKHPTYNPQMTLGEPYNKGFRKDQLTGSYGNFKTVEVKSSGERYPTDVIYFKTAESEGEVCHPTQKPVELGRYLIRTYTNKGDIVLDNTCGSGSFLVSAALEGRKFIGIEKNQEVFLFKHHTIDYVEVSKRRAKEAMKLYRRQTSLDTAV